MLWVYKFKETDTEEHGPFDAPKMEAWKKQGLQHSALLFWLSRAVRSHLFCLHCVGFAGYFVYGAYVRRVDANRKPLSNWLSVADVPSFGSVALAAPKKSFKF
jgi:hypothetical protein